MAKKDSRITKVIKFNLNDRGWKHNGKDRSNYDIPGMIRKMNSPEIQEQVEGGTLHGFCGHQIRERYGMIPPELVIIDGKTILLEPAIRTVYLKAHENGDVEHKQEFYENPTGEHVYRQYKTQLGGFSTAMNFFIDGPMLRPNIFGGFDYVFSPNFQENACIGVFDSAVGASELPLVHQLLERQIVSMYDSINDSNQLYDYLQAQSEKNRKLELELRRIRLRDERRVQKAKQLETDEFDSLICSDTLDFEQALRDAEAFNYFKAPAEQAVTDKEQVKANVYINGIMKLAGK